MDWQRNLLGAAIVAVFAVLFVRWNEFQEVRRPSPATTAAEILVPDVPGKVADSGIDQPGATAGDDRLISVETDVLRLVIDARGGDIVRAELLGYPVSQAPGAAPFLMLNRTRDQVYVAQSGLIGPGATDRAGMRPLFRAEHQAYRLGEGEELRVPLQLQQGDLSITKEFVLRRGDYLVEVRYRLRNQGAEPWVGRLFGQIQRDRHDPVAAPGFGMQPYLGAALSTPEENYKKLSFDDLDKKAFETERRGGWVAMVQHYFVSAWIPPADQVNRFQLRRLGDRELYALGFIGAEQQVGPGETGSFGAGFYVGPKDQDHLEEIAPFLDLTIDYGWLWWLAKPLFAGLQLLHALLGNWGWAVVALTVLIKLVFFPLSAASYRSMARMRKLQPEMMSLRERYGEDRQKLSQEVMALYKREKVNPMGGCLPMLIQMPVFIALYWVLSESVELRQAPWILWISDLSVRDPLYVLPVLNGISMYVLQTLQPAPPDPTQAKVMKIMPVAFSFFFVLFPAGLVLYWTVNSVLSIAQQWVITRRIEAG
ncbi:MAG: membrane protein insertase YidC [Pseudomonadota bacterium]